MKKMIILSFIFAVISGLNGFSEDKNTGDIPHGRVVSFGYAESKIFPGTQRLVTVYIPDQIDSVKPACVYVQQDGFGREQNQDLILDTLIAKHEIPVIVGVFVAPGYLASNDKNTPGRPNRCFEYDAVGDSYARFILEEILPAVAKNYHLNLSANGNDRSIGGVSSGGISAFNAAWERPDAFSRVYCVSGSFVGFRGGNMFPVFIRKTEAKPIRAYLTTGTKDMENCAGDWTLLDMEMDKALKFSGYDYQFIVLEGGHGAGWEEHFANAMRFLWKDWPSPVKAGISAPRVRDIIMPDQGWQLVTGDHHNICGAAFNSKGEVFFADTVGNNIYKIATDDKINVYRANSGFCNGLSFGPKDELYTVSEKTGKVMCYDTSGKATVYADGIYGRYVIADPNGGLYITGKNKINGTDKVWLLKDGKKVVVDDGLKCAAGIAMRPDRSFLAVGESSSHWVYSYQIASDGKLVNKERFFTLHIQDWDDNAGAESVCYDKEGHLYIATRMGIQVCAWDGPVQVILPLPEGRITGLCFGGADLNMIFAFCGDKIYKRTVKNHGLGAFSPWTAMKPGQL
jgi:gluconolactonase